MEIVFFLGVLLFLGWWTWFTNSRPQPPEEAAWKTDTSYFRAIHEETLAKLDKLDKAKEQPAGPESHVTVNVNLPGEEGINTGHVSSAPPVHFKPGEPQTFEEYGAQDHVVGDMRDEVRRMANVEALALDMPHMFLGKAGLGKTLLAKIVANEISIASERTVPFFEIIAADVTNIADLDARVLLAHNNPGCVFFIDEVHDIANTKHGRKLYLLLEEGRYQFHGDVFPTTLNPFTRLAATTDWGALHGAEIRRYVTHELLPHTYDQLLNTLQNRPFPIDEDAARYIVDRTHFGGAPWEPLQLYKRARIAAEAQGRSCVTLPTAELVVQRHQIDELGLTRMDRAIIDALLKQPRYRNVKGGGQELVGYVASEASVVAMAGIDPAGYRSTIKPKLMSRGLLVIVGGQRLTPKAVQLYGKELHNVTV